MTQPLADIPLILAIDTSTRYAGVGLARGGTLLAEYSWFAGINHSVQLLPVIKAVLQENGARLGEVAALALACGPGSFNGLRVGMATAKAFCRTLQVPLLGASTLEVEAYPHAAFPGDICAIHDAGRGDLAWATFTARGAGWTKAIPEQISRPQDLIGAIRGPTLVCGEPPEWAMASLMEQTEVVHTGTAARLRRPAALAELAWRRFQAGEADDVESLQPLYLRRPPGGG